MIIHLSSDLMASSGLKTAAREREMPIQLVSDPGKVAPLIENNPIGLLIIDLQTRGLNVRELMKSLPASPPPTLAYAQHVREELLHQAEEAGIKEILTRGQFSRSLSDVVAKAIDHLSNQPSPGGQASDT